MPDETLRLRAREAIRDGRIPNQLPNRMLRGRGVGERCAICGAGVGGLGVDLDFIREDGAVRHPVHIDCFAAWEFECRGSGECAA